MISLEIFGKPTPQMRPRFSTRGKVPHVFDPQSKEKEQYRWQIKSQFREEIMEMPLRMDVTFFMTIPKSTSALKKRQMENGLIGHMKKPDVDNLTKFILDCLNNLVFVDDAQVCDIRSRKIYSSTPRTLIRLIPLADTKKELLYENCLR